MRHEDHETCHSTPKLMLSSHLRLSPENPGRLTPPLHIMASVPFRWEERPGKAIVVGGINNGEHAVSKSLELPPRLIGFFSSVGKSNSKVIKLMPSPDTVLDIPHITYPSPDDQEHKGTAFFGSSRSSTRRRRRSLSFSFSNSDCNSTSNKIKGGRRSLVSLSQNYFWEKVCGGLKQLIMPWTKKQYRNGSDGL